MLVQNDPKLTAFPQQDRAISIKAGDVLQASVKERLPNNEAVLQMKGQEVKVKLEGRFPESGAVKVEVTGSSNGIPVVKAAATAANEAVSPSDRLEGLGLSKDVKAAAAILMDKGQPVTKQTIAELKAFMEKGPGTAAEKLETISAMASKGLDITAEQLKSVHEALHGKYGNAIDDLVRSFGSERAPGLKHVEGMRKVEEALRKLLKTADSPEKARAIHELIRVLKHGGDTASAVKAFVALFGSAIQEQPSLQKGLAQLLKADAGIIMAAPGEEASAVQDKWTKQAEALLKKSADFGKVLDFIQEKLSQDDEMPVQDKDKLQQAFARAGELASKGREMAARQELMTAFPETDMARPASGMAYQLNEDIFAGVPAQSKDMVVTAITKKLSQAAIDFQKVKRDIANNLDTSAALLKQQSGSQARPVLEATIKQLDKAILKSDLMLYTDMGTEKKLMQASSQLAEARKWLGRGEHAKAAQIVSEVKAMIEKLVFKPSDVRVKHFVSKELMQLEPPPLAGQLARTVAAPADASARSTFEYMRGLGLMRESDIAHSLVSKNQLPPDSESNLKSILLKLMHSETDKALSLKAEQTLSHLTGQQLLSKNDPSGLQTLQFALPIMLQDKAESVKVFLQSKNKGQAIDWENCSLYFLLETKKLGDVGILLNSADRLLSVTIKNDRPDFKSKIEPLADMAAERLRDIGYNVGSIQFAPLTPPQDTKVPEEKLPAKKPIYTERGYDFTV